MRGLEQYYPAGALGLAITAIVWSLVRWSLDLKRATALTSSTWSLVESFGRWKVLLCGRSGIGDHYFFLEFGLIEVRRMRRVWSYAGDPIHLEFGQQTKLRSLGVYSCLSTRS